MDSLTKARALKAALLALAGLLVLALAAGCGGEAVGPTPTIAPTAVAPTPTASVQPEASLGERAWEATLALAEELSPRESGTEEELRAAEWLADRFSVWGYEVWMEEFEVIELFEAVGLVIDLPEDWEGDDPTFWERPTGREVWVVALPVDPSARATEGYEVEGILAYGGHGREEDLSGRDLSGRIALIETGGGVTLREKVDRAAEAGAEAVAFFSEEVVWDRLYDETDIPAISLVPGIGGELARIAREGGEIEARVEKEPTDPRLSRNVIAELRNDIEDDGTLIIGAHYDTTPDTQGANDNGSGVGVVLTLAEELADDELPFDLNFVLFGAEEIGLHGSFEYVGGLEEEELERIVGMINLDVVGAGDLTAIGSEGMVEFAVETGAGMGIEVSTFEAPPGYGSDHVAFLAAGVDTVFLFADDVTYINSPLDRVELLEYEPIEEAAELAMEMILRLSNR